VYMAIAILVTTSCMFQVKYVESSAKHKVHVDKAFHDLVRVIR